MAEPLLVVKGASKSYGDLVALEPLDLKVPAGSASRSSATTARASRRCCGCIAGLARPVGRGDRGRRAPCRIARRPSGHAFVPDDPMLYDDLSVREHLAYVASLHGVDD